MTRSLTLFLLTTAVLADALAGQAMGSSSLALTHNRITYADSVWSGTSQTGVSLRLGLWDFRPWKLSLLPDLQVSATSVGGIDAGKSFAVSDGELGLRIRTRHPWLRPSARVGFPIWRTVQVERSGERRDYAQRLLAFSEPTLGAGIEIAPCGTGAGLDVSLEHVPGTVRSVEAVDRTVPAQPRFREDESLSEPFRLRRLRIGWSGPFNIVRPLPRRVC